MIYGKLALWQDIVQVNYMYNMRRGKSPGSSMAEKLSSFLREYTEKSFVYGEAVTLSAVIDESSLRRWLQLRIDFDSTAIRPLFDFHSTTVRPRYDHSTTFVTTVGTAV